MPRQYLVVKGLYCAIIEKALGYLVRFKEPSIWLCNTMSRPVQPDIILYFYVFLTHYACSVSIEERAYLAMINILVRNRRKARKCSDSRHRVTYYSDQQFRMQKFILHVMLLSVPGMWFICLARAFPGEWKYLIKTYQPKV